MRSLTLYYFPSCPYCQKVLRYMSAEGIDIPKKNIHEKTQYQDELVKFGGQAQVPCLVIDGEALYESDDIIDWLKENVSKK